MTDFDATNGGSDVMAEEQERIVKDPVDLPRYLLKRFVLLVSFGPGVLGFLWLIGRILKR